MAAADVDLDYTQPSLWGSCMTLQQRRGCIPCTNIAGQFALRNKPRLPLRSKPRTWLNIQLSWAAGGHDLGLGVAGQAA